MSSLLTILLRNRTVNNQILNSSFQKRSIYLCKKLCKSDDDSTKKPESPLKRLLDDSATFEDTKVQNIQQQWATMPYPQGKFKIGFIAVNSKIVLSF